jgi:hypothetical protein
LKDGGTSGKWQPWHAQTIPQRTTMIGIVTLAPTLFISRFMGSSTRMYGILFDDQPVNTIEEGRNEISY